MQWIHDFQLFLFDFDGLLVDTEPLHYQAYANALATRNHRWSWSFSDFVARAHYNADALREGLSAEFPELIHAWEAFYAEKKRAYQELLTQGKIQLMPGVAALLQALDSAKIRRCVVTLATRNQTNLIRSQQPLLDTIPHWITREDYERPKPHPECYLRAIALHSRIGDRIIGFEDSLRGVSALQQTPAIPVLISSTDNPLLQKALDQGVVSFRSFEEISTLDLLRN